MHGHDRVQTYRKRGIQTSPLAVNLTTATCRTGLEPTRAQLLAFYRAGIITPQSTVYRPERRYLEWHGDEVFKKPGRE